MAIALRALPEPEPRRTALRTMRDIKPIDNHGSIQLKWSYRGQRYNLHPIPGARFDNPGDLERVQDIAAQIALDIKRGLFDPSLDRYRPVAIVRPAVPKKPVGPMALLDLWDTWVETLDLSEDTKAQHYRAVRRMVTKAKPGPVMSDVAWFDKASSALGASTHNDRLRYLSRCLTWAVDHGLVPSNPYKAIKTKTARVAKVKPFTLDEIGRILGDLREHHPAYAPFVAFMLMTGCRTSEAVGLRWSKVDLERGELTIEDSMPISALTGKPVRKGTKTDMVTVLDLSDELRDLLVSLGPGRPDDLIFRSPKGCIINRRNFRADAWKPSLERLGIAYRKPYSTRHTMASHAIEQGANLPQVAYLLGHRDTAMVSKTYGHMVNRPKLPDIT